MKSYKVFSNKEGTAVNFATEVDSRTEQNLLQ